MEAIAETSLRDKAYIVEVNLYDTLCIAESFYVHGPKTPQTYSKISKTLLDDPFNILNIFQLKN